MNKYILCTIGALLFYSFMLSEKEKTSLEEPTEICYYPESNSKIICGPQENQEIIYYDYFNKNKSHNDFPKLLFDCEDIKVEGRNGQVRILGLTAVNPIVTIFDKKWRVKFSCIGKDCNAIENIALEKGTYHVKINTFNAFWIPLCSVSMDVEVTEDCSQDCTTDQDRDGISDDVEGLGDTDKDGIPDRLDLDSDNDGIPDLIEAGGIDENGNGIADHHQPVLQGRDTDGDGIPNRLDLDSDNDGIPDIREIAGIDRNNDGKIDYFSDSDNDGFADSYDADIGNDGIAENPAVSLIITGNDNTGDGAPDSYKKGNNDISGLGTPFDNRNDNLMYAWYGDDDLKDPDFVAMIDFNPTSAAYGTVKKIIPLQGGSTIGNEPHHLGLIKETNQLVTGGLLSLLRAQDELFYYDVSNPSNPVYTHSFNVPKSSIADEFVSLPNGNYLVTMMGGADGADPGRVAEFTPNGDLIEEWPLNPPAKDFNPHGISVRPELDLMVTSDFVDPASTLLGPVEVPDLVRVWKLSTREIIKTIPVPGAGGSMDLQLVPNDPQGRAIMPAFGGKIYLIDTQKGVATELYDCARHAEPVSGLSTPHIVKFSKDGKRMYVTLYASGSVLMFDSSDPSNIILLDELIIGAGSGLHYIRLSDDEKRIVVSGYFLNQSYGGGIHNHGSFSGTPDTIGLVLADGDRKIHVINVDRENDALSYDARFQLDGNIAFPTGPARPHGMVFNIASDKTAIALANPYDLDADNDGILDSQEANIRDHDKNGIADGTDNNKNGWSDQIELQSTLNLPDTDGDGLADFIDIDADGDGIVDFIEAQPTIGYRRANCQDRDMDGIDDAFDNNPYQFGGQANNGIIPIDTDADGLSDYLDTDADNDEIADAIEGWDSNGNSVLDGNEPALYITNDADQDGLTDQYDTYKTGIIPTNSTYPHDYPAHHAAASERDWRSANRTSNTCDDLTVSIISSGVLITRLNSPNNLIKVFDKNQNWRIVYECAADCSKPEMSINLSKGEYAVNIQSYSSTWELICDKSFDVDINEGNSYNDCDQLAVSTDASSILINGLTDGISIVKIFDKLNNWNVAYECTANCTYPTNSVKLPTSEYAINIQTYTDNWEFICEKSFDIAVEESGGDVCSQLNFEMDNNGLSITNNQVQNSILKIFDRNDNWRIVYECTADCGNTIQIPLQHGLYAFNYQAYTEDWTFICERSEHFQIGGVTARQSHFVAFVEQKNVQLQWLTNLNKAIKYFEIEKSADAIAFQPIERMANNSDEKNFVTFYSVDKTPSIGKNYYRIKYVFDDNRFSYSSVQRVVIETNWEQMVAYPNPVKDYLWVNLKIAKGQSGNLNLFTQFGQKLKSFPTGVIGENPVKIDLRSVQNGIYYIVFQSDDKRKLQTKKVVIHRDY